MHRLTSLPPLRAAALAAALLAWASTPVAYAQGAAQAAMSTARTYALPAQPLGAALNELARQAGVAIAVDADLVRGRSAPAVSGTLTLQQAVARVLAGSGLVAHAEGSALVLRRAPAAAAAGERTLPEVRVVGETPALGTFGARGEPNPVEPGVVTAQTVERLAVNDLEDLFAGQPEVQVGGGHGVAQKTYVRGIEDTLLNVTIDGATQAGQAFHHTGRVQLEPELLRLVEVRPGTGDAAAGPGALGGVLRFVTKDPEDMLRPGQRVGALAKLGYFSNAEGLKLHSSVYGQLSDDWSALLALTHQDLDDYEDGAGRTVEHSGARQQLGFFKLVGRPAGGHTVRLSYDAHRDRGERTQRPQWVESSFNRAYPLRTERGTWNLGYAWQPADERIDLALNLYRTGTELEQDVTDRWGVYQGRIRSTGLDLRNTSHLGAHELSYGFDHRADRITAGPATDPSSERERGKVTGVFVQDRIALTSRLDLSLGARWDRYTLHDTNGESFSAQDVSPNASIRYAVTPALALLAGHARALRGPKIRDAFKLDSISNDPDLQPERARTSELGFEYAHAAWRLNGKAYRTTIRDAIQDRIGGPLVNENVGTLQSRGVLLHTSYDWRQVRLGAAFHRNRVTLDDRPLNTYDDNGLGTSQGNTLTASVDWRVNARLDVGWLGRFVRGIDALDTSAGRVRKPGYSVHDLYASWRPTGRDDVTLSLVVSNLFDKSYVDHGTNEDFQHIPGYEGVVGSREPGRELRLTATVRF